MLITQKRTYNKVRKHSGPVPYKVAEAVMFSVCSRANLTIEKFAKGRKFRNTVRARRMAWYMLRVLGYSFRQIGASYLGPLKHHATIIFGINKLKSLAKF